MTYNITAVWTRDVDLSDKVGRLGILLNIRAALNKAGNLTEIRQRSVMEAYGKPIGFMQLLFAILTGIMRGEWLPLQCALFDTSAETARRIIATKPDVVILDSIRQYTLLCYLRRCAPSLTIILDMDDMMSRRYKLLLDGGLEPSLGMFRQRLPAFFNGLIRLKWFSRLILHYESRALRAVESKVIVLADLTVMTSEVEVELLRSRCSNFAKKCIAVTPPASMPIDIKPFDPQGRSLRFAYIGSDALVQNATAIDAAIDIWRDEKPSQELWLFGKLTRSYDNLPPNVVLHGFVEAISTIYDGRTVLLAPTRLPGGVKTKFLEAFAHGAPVIGTSITFEGVASSPAFLRLEDVRPRGSLFEEAKIVPILVDAARLGRETVEQKYSEDEFQKKWVEIVSGFDFKNESETRVRTHSQ